MGRFYVMYGMTLAEGGCPGAREGCLASCYSTAQTVVGRSPPASDVLRGHESTPASVSVDLYAEQHPVLPGCVEL